MCFQSTGHVSLNKKYPAAERAPYIGVYLINYSRDYNGNEDANKI